MNEETAKSIIDHLSRRNVSGHKIIFNSESQADKNIPEIMYFLGEGYKSEKLWVDTSNGEVAYRFTKT